LRTIPQRGIVHVYPHRVPVSPQEDSAMAASTYTVVGMTCEHCVRSVQEELGQIPGVATVDVDLASGSVTVTSDDVLDRDLVQAAVEEAGYELTS
jgi:copper chaperone